MFFLGIRGIVTLYNKLNYQAEFTWTPIMGERGTAFSIRPAAGNYVYLKVIEILKKTQIQKKCFLVLTFWRQITQQCSWR